MRSARHWHYADMVRSSGLIATDETRVILVQ
jgi:hypothetical protein